MRVCVCMHAKLKQLLSDPHSWFHLHQCGMLNYVKMLKFNDEVFIKALRTVEIRMVDSLLHAADLRFEEHHGFSQLDPRRLLFRQPPIFKHCTILNKYNYLVMICHLVCRKWHPEKTINGVEPLLVPTSSIFSVFGSYTRLFFTERLSADPRNF
jgi:hypothetical protein